MALKKKDKPQSQFEMSDRFEKDNTLNKAAQAHLFFLTINKRENIEFHHLFADRNNFSVAVSDQGEGVGHPDPEIRGDAQPPKIFYVFSGFSLAQK